jgi:hypothetical protein
VQKTLVIMAEKDNNNPVKNDKDKREEAKAAAKAAAEAARKEAAISAEADAKINAAFDANATEPSEVTEKKIAGTQAAEKEEAATLAKRRGIASGLQSLSKSGGLTSDLMGEARTRAADAGVTDEQFESFVKNKGIKESLSPEEAAQNVMFQKEFGSGLDALAAMQDPNYEVGSGSSLLKPARSIGPRSGGFRRAARRLRRQGYGAAAQQMAMAGEMARMGEPSIDTPAARGQRMAQRIIAGREAQKQDKIVTGSSNISGAVGVEEPQPNDSLQQPKKAAKYESPLDKTRNKKPFGVDRKEDIVPLSIPERMKV